MPKRTLFTNITPLPPSVSREVAIAMLHNHDEMIELNPLVIEHHPIKTPRDAPADEFLDCAWQELTDKIHYLPGGMVKGKVSYKACFHDIPSGLQTHIYAPMGLDIREKWSIGGSLPGEPPEPRELGVEVPRQGLYLREDGDMKCNMLLTSFVRKNLDNAHKVLVERILQKAVRVEDAVNSGGVSATPSTPNPRFQSGSHMSNSRFINSPLVQQRPPSPQMLSPQQDLGWQTLANHPAYRVDEKRASTGSLPPYQSHSQRFYTPQTKPQTQPHPGPSKQFVAELPGSTYHVGNLTAPSELSGSDATSRRSLNLPSQSEPSSMTSDFSGYQRPKSQAYVVDNNHSMASGYSDRASMVSELPSSLQEGTSHPR